MVLGHLMTGLDGPIAGGAMAGRERLSGVGGTALGMARVRARESRRPDRLFDDPYAEAFLAASPDALPEERVSGSPLGAVGALFQFHGALRTRFFDDYLLAAARAGCLQVVLLAAGLDTRAFRLDWPEGVRLFELDLPEVLGFKEEVLAAWGSGGLKSEAPATPPRREAKPSGSPPVNRGVVPRCGRVVLPVDLREGGPEGWPAALTGAGLDPARPTAWLIEGLLIYLSPEEARRLLSAAGELSAALSQLAFEFRDALNDTFLERARAIPGMRRYTSLWKGGLGPDAPEWLARHGWRVRLQDRAAVAASYGRATPERSGGSFLTAVRGGAEISP
jgi:O-methyltransferase involved in polyketide biosynthesis